MSLVTPSDRRTPDDGWDELSCREIFDHVNDIIYAHDMTGRFTALNRAGEELTGYSRKEARALTIFDVVVPEDHARLEAMLRGGLSSRTNLLTIVTRSGERRLVEVSARFRWVEGERVGVQGVARDVTERFRTEQFEEDRSSVLEMIVKHAPLSETLNKIAAMLEAHYPEAYATVSRIEGGRHAFVAAPSLPEALQAFIDRMWAKLDPAQLARAQRLEEIVICDLSREPLPPACRETFDKYGLRSLWSLPVVLGDGTLYGRVSLRHRHLSDISPYDVRCLKRAAQLVALAVEHRQLIDQLAYRASHDALTSLPNRTVLQEELERHLARAKRQRVPLALLFIDLDRFKQVNDTFGHHGGDVLLTQVAWRLKGCVRRGDTLARVGGDEFALLLGEPNDRQTAERAAAKIARALEQPFELDGREVMVRATVGVSLYPDDGVDGETLLRRADAAMYRNKALSRRIWTTTRSGDVAAHEADHQQCSKDDPVDGHDPGGAVHVRRQQPGERP